MPSDVRALHAATAGLVGERDAAQPLLTQVTAEGRVELSGATAANWVVKTANLLTDGYGSPQQVGLLLPLHWQTVCVLLGGVMSGATVVTGATADDVAGCDLVLVRTDTAGAVDAPDLLVLAGDPLGRAPVAVPAGAADFAREVVAHGDLWSGPAPSAARVVCQGRPVAPRALRIGPADRVLTAADPRSPEGLEVLLGVLAAGASVVLLPDPGAVDVAAVAREEQATATAGTPVPGVRDVLAD